MVETVQFELFQEISLDACISYRKLASTRDYQNAFFETVLCELIYFNTETNTLPLLIVFLQVTQ